MEFTWKTEMRRSANGSIEDQQAREVDQLHGQAAAGRLEGGRWQIHTMPDAGSFGTDAVISDADARTLALAVLRDGLLDAWADLIEALSIMGQHPLDGVSPTHCMHDALLVMADPAAFTVQERDRLSVLGFDSDDDDDDEPAFRSSRYGSA